MSVEQKLHIYTYMKFIVVEFFVKMNLIQNNLYVKEIRYA